MKRTIAIGDIHGCKKPLEEMLFEKLQIKEEDTIYLLGDLIDRGPDSKGVIDLILSLKMEGFNIQALLGNHEEMMLQSGLNQHCFLKWIRNGGTETLKSFEVNLFADMPEKYKDFFAQLKHYIETDQYIFVHAGLSFAHENIFEDREAMLWLRTNQDFEPALKNKKLIHGHTPVSLDYIKNQKGNCFNIDGGCVYPERSWLGNLVAVELPEFEFIAVKNKK